MEIQRVYNEPVDENDITNKRYVDKNIKAVVDKTIADTLDKSLGNIVVDSIKNKNLFDISSVDWGRYEVITSDLTIESGSFTNSFTKHIYNIQPAEIISISANHTSNFRFGYMFLNNENRVITGKYMSKPETSFKFEGILVPDNAVKLSICQLDALVNSDIKIQVEKGPVVTEYIPYKKYGYNSTESMGEILVDDVKNKNLFNIYGNVNEKYDYTTGEIFVFSSGRLRSSSNFASGNGPGQVIEVEPYTEYTISFDVVTMSKAGISTVRVLGISAVGKIDAYLVNKQFTATGFYKATFNTGVYKRVWISFNGIFDVNNLAARDTVIYKHIQFEKGYDATEYVDYKKTSFSSVDSAGEMVVDDITCKNLFNFDNLKMTVGTVYYDTKTISVTQYVNPAKNTLKELCPNMVAGEIYTLNMETTSDSNYIYLKSSQSIWYNGAPRTITEKDLNSTIIFYGFNSDETTYSEIRKIQIEKGESISKYVPYKAFGYTSGSNENGSWVKYDDGVLIQHGTGMFGNSGTLDDSYALTTFPLPFVNANWSIQYTPLYTNTYGQEYTLGTNLVGTHEYGQNSQGNKADYVYRRLSYLSPIDAGQNALYACALPYSWIAIGYWK